MKRLLVASMTMACACAWATDYAWNGGTSGEWTTAGNWIPDTGYPNGADDTASFAAGAATAVTVDSAVAVKGITVSGTAQLTLTGAAISLGADGIVSTSRAAVDVSNAIVISAAETPFVNGGSLDSSVNRTIAGPFHFRGVISGAGGIAKSGRGSIHLYCANPFEGVYTARGDQNTEDGNTTIWFPPAYRKDFRKGSSDTYIYDCGALGCQKADFKGNNAEQLIVCAAGTVDVPIVPSLSMNSNIAEGAITVQGFTGDLVFNKAVETDAFYTVFDIRCAANVHFRGDVCTLYGKNYLWFNASGAHVYFHHPLKSYNFTSTLATGVECEAAPSVSDIGLHLCGSGVPSALTYYTAFGKVPVFCGAENVLPPYLFQLVWQDNVYHDLCGYDQLLAGGGNGHKPMQGKTVNGEIGIDAAAAETKAFGFTSTTGTAKLRFVGVNIRSFTYTGALLGGAGIEWAPQGNDQVLTLSGNQAKSIGELDVKSGKLALAGGYALTTLGSLKVAANASAEIDATAAAVHKVHTMALVSGGTGGLKLAQNVKVSVNTLTVDGGDPLPAGTYTKDSEALAGTLTGDGEIVVTAFGIPCEWSGAASGDWNDPGNWSIGGVPDATHDVTIGSATVTVNGSAPKVRELTLQSGATLVFPNAVSSVEADSITVGAGALVTVSGAFTDESAACRVWLKCGDLTVSDGGAIDVSKRGWRPKNGTSADGDGTGPGQPGWWFAGATHGGRGAFVELNYTETIKYPYGNAYEPTTAGSSGQGSASGADVSGGGVVRIEATGRVTVNGSILANGGSATRDWWRYDTAGAGGSIWIDAASVGGSGTIAAEGGKGVSPDLPLIRYFNRTSGYDHYPAGGGRIAIYVDAAAQAANPATGLYVSAAEGTYQGRDAVEGYTVPGYSAPALGFADADWNCTGAEPGTVYLSESTLLYQLFGSGLSGRLVGVESLSFSGDVTMTRGHVRSDVEGFTVTVGGNLTIDGDARLDVGGVCMTNKMAAAEVWAGRELNKITVGGNLTVRNGGALEIHAAETNETMTWGGEVVVEGSVTVGNRGRLIATCDQENLGAPHFAVGGDFTVAAGGVVSADGRGGLGGSHHDVAGCPFNVKHWRGFGPGAGNGQGAGGYGGMGGYRGDPYHRNPEFVEYRGQVYGDPWRPDMGGSGGGEQVSKNGGSGGGLIFVEAGGALTVDGTVTANGLSPKDSGCAGTSWLWAQEAGSGGGIYLCGETFSGTGTITANGGEAMNEKGLGSQAPGGGGRVAVRTGYAKQLAGKKVSIRKIGNEIPGFTGTVTANAGTLYKPVKKINEEMDYADNYIAPENGTVRYSTIIDAPGLAITIR